MHIWVEFRNPHLLQMRLNKRRDGEEGWPNTAVYIFLTLSLENGTNHLFFVASALKNKITYPCRSVEEIKSTSK